MKASVEHRPDGYTALRISAEWPEVAADYDALLADYARLALPGFRPGRAPRAVIEQRLRRQIRDEFTARCGRRLVREALRDRNLRVAGPIPVVAIQFAPRREFAFTAECVPAPELELPDYAAAPLSAATEAARRDELTAWLLAHTAWDVPAPLVRQECRRDAQPAAAPGSDAWQAAAQRVKLLLILEQIAEAEGIDADRQDVEARLQQMAAESGVPPDELRRQLGADGLGRLPALLRAEQTLAYLLERKAAEGIREQRDGER